MSPEPSRVSRLLFSWLGPYIRQNVRTPLLMEGLLPLPPSLESSSQRELLESALNRLPGGRLRLLRAVFVIIRRDLLKVFGLSLVLLVSGLASPLVLRALLSALEGKASLWPSWLASVAGALSIPAGTLTSLCCACLLFLFGYGSALAVHHMFFAQVCLAVKAHSALRALVYEKTLRLARHERSSASTGMIMNLALNDTFKVLNWLIFGHSSWYHPMQIAIACWLLFSLVGPAALYGVASMIIPLLVAGLLVRHQNRQRRALLSVVDERVGQTAEVLSHIKTVKFQAWEQPLSARISALRDRELQKLRRINFVSSLVGLFSNLTVTLTMLVTFSVYAARGGALDAAVVFPAMSLIMLLRFGLNNLPDSVMNAFEAIISLRRIELFLSRDDFRPHQQGGGVPGAISFSPAASFEWGPGKPAVEVDALEIKPGELVAVVGGVGSGKSALLLAVLNEISARAGAVHAHGSVGYVAQQPWVVSDSIRNNITSSRPWDPDLYRRALESSSLEGDLAALPQGDATIVGERGINLSGGQRQRVALARAMYSQPQILLLDDPLSALDPEVANAVFDRLICGEARESTRLLVTHRLEYALRADRVLVIEGGRILEDGSPDALARDGTRFSELLGFHADITDVSGPDGVHPGPEGSAGEGQANAEDPAGDRESAAVRSVVEDEERDIGAVDSAVLRDYLRHFLPGLLGLSLVAAVVGRHFFSVLSDLWLAWHSRGSSVDYRPFIFGYAGLVSLFALCHFLRWYLFLSCGLAAGRRCHGELLASILSAPLRFFEANPVGRIVNRFSRDLETVELSLPRTLQDVCNCSLDVAVVCIMLAVMEPWTILALVPVLLLYVRVQWLFRPTSRETQRLESISRSPFLSLLSESLGGVETIRASGLSQRFQERLEGYLNTNLRAHYTMTATNRWAGLRLELLAGIVIFVAGISVSLLPASAASVAVSGLLLTYAINFGGAMNWLVRSSVMAESQLTSVERIRFYSSIPPESTAGTPAPQGWPSAGRVRLEGLSVQYRPDLEPALKALSCDVPAGSRVGVVGRTGSGKSTLILALARLLEPSAGHVEIDGVNTSSLTLRELRGALTVVPQEPVLFSGPLRDSLDPFGASSDSNIIAALKRVELDQFVLSLPGGLSATVLEGGSNFSCGQRQLLCLARALLRASKVIILDEATANIDVETDHAIQRAIRREFRGSTVFVVAHRLGTVIDSDLMMVLQNGELAEFAPPEELLSQPRSLLSSFVRELQRANAA